MKETDLGNALCFILKEIWHYPSWSKRDDAKEHLKLPCVLIKADETDEDSKKIKNIEFEYEGKNYLFIFEEDNGYFRDGNYGKIKILFNSKPLLEIIVTHDLLKDSEYYQYHYLDVEVFAFGNWIKDLIEIKEKLKLAEQKYWLEFEYGLIKEKADKIS